MPLHPQAQATIDADRAANVPALETMTPEQARERAKVRQQATVPDGLVARVEDRTIPGPDGNEIPVRLYYPADTEGACPMLVWFHAGGWVTGDLDGSDAVCSLLAFKSGSIVMSVDYRLAPEHPFPAGVNDAYAATKWAVDHAEELGSRDDVVGVGGASAGGNIAAAVTLMAKDREEPALAHQLLVYPVTNCNFDTDTYIELAEGYGLSLAGMQWYWEQYLGGPEMLEAGNPLASPMQAEVKTGLPRAHVITAEYDPLREEGEEYAHRLEEDGVFTVLTRYPGMLHGFFTRVGIYDDATRAVTEAAEQFRISLAVNAINA